MSRIPPPLRSPLVWLLPATGLALFLLLLATGTDRAVFLALNRAGHLAGSPFWLHLTMLGDGAVALAMVLPCIRRAPHCFWAALAAGVFAALWTQVTKQFIDLPRPLSVLAPGQFYHAGPAYRHVSFPSGHAATAFAFAGIWIMGAAGWLWWRASVLLLAVLVGLSRIMVGVHWPIDVLWGMAGGWLGAWLGLALHARQGWRTDGLGGAVAGLVLLGVAASLLVSRHIGIPAVMPAQRLVGGASLLWGSWELWAMWPRILQRLRRRRAWWRQQVKGRTDG